MDWKNHRSNALSRCTLLEKARAALAALPE
jgi:hypothetical protein